MDDAAFKEIAGLTDHELAFFVKGRLPHLQESVREEIMRYVQAERGLQEETIRQLLTRKIDAASRWSPRCDRCGSDKLALKTYLKTCRICGYSTSRREWLRLIGRLLDGFG